MANPPKHLITRTLVKRYFKRFLPTMTDSTKPFIDEIIECYRQHGAFSEKCQPIVDRMDNAYAKSMKTKADYSKLDVQGEVLGTLRKPVYPFQKKGRYRTLRPRQRDIYDGLF